jgi:putative copper export protein/mono/diheme cytochrome c family protein/peroxiredoxin
MMDAMIVGARTVHFASAILLFGGLLFVLAVATPVWRDAHRAIPQRRRTDLPRALAYGAWTLVASVISGMIWLAAEAAIMSGTPLAQAINADTFGLVLGRTEFGRLWVLRFVLALALGTLLLSIGRSANEKRRLRIAVGAVLVAALYLASLAWAGHAAAGQASGRYLQIVSDVVHLLAAGAWLGALPGLVFLLGGAQPLEATALMVRRFSTLGALSVSVLVVSGLGNSWYLVGTVPALIGTDYGHLLLVKLALFAAMVALAAINRLSLTARLIVRNPSNPPALHSLRRNATLEIAAGIIVIAIVAVLGIKVPAAHQSPAWPFDYTLSWQAAQQSFAVGAAVVVTGIGACVAAVVAIGGVLRNRPRLGITGLGVILASAAAGIWLLAVPAYPTTYAAAPVSYTTDSIIRGATLYTQSCSVCHGPQGRGDGPAALTLPIVPTDLAAHASGHRVGELFWWIAHGIPRTPMPGFTSRLSDAEIWDLVQFLRAQSDAEAATALDNHVQPWRFAIVAPDFTFELAGQGQESLSQRRGSSITLLVLYALPQSLPYLRALAAQTSVFRETGVRVIAMPLSATAPSADAEPRGDGGSIVAITSANVISAYTMFARRDIDARSAAPATVTFLIDRQGYLRARWIGVPDSLPDRTAEVIDQAELLRRERQRTPLPAGHLH